MGAPGRHSRTSRYLRADIPHVTADDRFIAVLADLAGSSTPAPDRSSASRPVLRARIAAVAASVALVSVGAAHAVEQFGGGGPAPVDDTETVDPAGSSEPAGPSEDRVRDRASVRPGEARVHDPVSTGNGDQAGSTAQDHAEDGSLPEAPAPQDQGGAGQDDVGHGDPAPDDPVHDESGPTGQDPEGDGDPTGGSQDPPDDPDTDPQVDRDAPDTDPDAGHDRDAEGDLR